MPPNAKKVPKEITVHGDTRIDNYFWLNQRDNREVIDYLKAENEYRDAVLSPVRKLEKKIYQEIIERIKQEDQSVPYPENGYYYYWRYNKEDEYPIHARKKGHPDAPEEIMLAVPLMAEGYDYYHVTGLNVSENGRYLAYGVDTIGRRKYILRFKDLSTGDLSQERIANTTGAAVWANDNKTVFYTLRDNTLRPYKVMKHIMGTDPANDEEIFHEKDSTFSVYVSKTRSDKYILLESYHTLSTETRLIDADHPEQPGVLFQERECKHEYYVYHHTNRFYILTNWNAKNFHVMQTADNHFSREHWEEVVPHREHVLLENVNISSDYLVLGERIDGLRQLRVRDLREKYDHYIEFDKNVYAAYPSNNHEFDAHQLRFKYTLLTTPTTTFDYDMGTREKKLLKREEVGGGFDSTAYRSERLWVTARDGAKVPVSMVYRKNLDKDGKIRYCSMATGHMVIP